MKRPRILAAADSVCAAQPEGKANWPEVFAEEGGGGGRGGDEGSIRKEENRISFYLFCGVVEGSIVVFFRPKQKIVECGPFLVKKKLSCPLMGRPSSIRGRGDLHACMRRFCGSFFAFDFAFLFIQLLPAPGVGRCLIDGGLCLASF